MQHAFLGLAIGCGPFLRIRKQMMIRKSRKLYHLDSECGSKIADERVSSVFFAMLLCWKAIGAYGRRLMPWGQPKLGMSFCWAQGSD